MSLFITFEGPDGSGKSTQARLLVAHLRASGYAVTETREPGGTPIGDHIRQLLLDPSSPPASPLAMAFLLSASRTQLVSDVIMPALAEGQIVVADRYADSTVAYQAGGQELDLDTVLTLGAIATGGLRPDITVYVDIEPAAGLARVAGRGPVDRLDALSLEFHRRVREAYHALGERESDRWMAVDGDFPPEQVHAAIMRAIEPRIARVTNVP